MATAIGTNVVTSLARHFILPEITDNIYGDQILTFRLMAAKKRMIRGGTQLEFPLMYTRMAAGGFYSGMDPLDVTPSDTVKNGALDWRQAYVPVTVDGLTMIKTDSPDAIANFLSMQFEQAEMEMAAILGTGVFSDAVTNLKSIDGIQGAVDAGSVAATYAGILRSSNTWWNSQVDAATATLTLAAMQSMFGSLTVGGRAPTLLCATQANFNRLWVLMSAKENIFIQPSGHDVQLASAGFHNLLFNGVPMVVDPNVQANHIYFLNEDFLYWGVSPRADFFLEDFQAPIQQDAMVSKLLWAGQLIVTNARLQGKMTVLTA